MNQTKYVYHQPGDKPLDTEIFVFGSNLAGRHGKGAALDAVKLYGARYGIGYGYEGRSFAIPTKDAELRVLSLMNIAKFVHLFLALAEKCPHRQYFVTAIGTGLAGYKHEEIAPLFEGAPRNCSFPIEWAKYLENNNDSKESASD